MLISPDVEVAQTRLTRHSLRTMRPSSVRSSADPWVDVGAANGPVQAAAIGDDPFARLPRAARFKSFPGLTRQGSEVGEADPRGHPMSLARSSLLLVTLVRAGDTAREQEGNADRLPTDGRARR